MYPIQAKIITIIGSTSWYDLHNNFQKVGSELEVSLFMSIFFGGFNLCGKKQLTWKLIFITNFYKWRKGVRWIAFYVHEMWREIRCVVCVFSTLNKMLFTFFTNAYRRLTAKWSYLHSKRSRKHVNQDFIFHRVWNYRKYWVMSDDPCISIS